MTTTAHPADPAVLAEMFPDLAGQVFPETSSPIVATLLGGAVCPRHGRMLSGGPVVWHCEFGRHGHGVQAADLDRDVTS